MTRPVSEPVSLAELKAQCRVVTSDEEAFLALYLLDARAHIEDYLGYALRQQTYDLTLERFPPCARYIELPRAPLKSIDAVTYTDENGVPQTWPSANYLAVKSTTPGQLALAYGVSWPTTRCEPESVKIRFTAGYDDGYLPSGVREAILLTAADWFANREAPRELSPAALALISKHRIRYVS